MRTGILIGIALAMALFLALLVGGGITYFVLTRPSLETVVQNTRETSPSSGASTASEESTPPKDATPAPESPAVSGPLPIPAEPTHQDILSLKTRGAGEADLLQAVARRSTRYVLSADDVIALHRAGVSKPVILSMLRHRVQNGAQGEKGEVAQRSPQRPS